MRWYKRFGLESNPFTVEPFAADYTLVNYSKLVGDLLYYTESGNMLLLEGGQGSGKTMMLRQIIQRYKGKGRVAYIDGKKLSSDIDIESILNKKGKGFMDTLMLRDKPQSMIVLLDGVEHISRRQFEKIKYYFDQNYIKTVVFTVHNDQQLDMPPSILDRIHGRHIVIPPIISFDALRIVRERFSDHFFLPDEVILDLFKRSQGNVKKLLQYCDKVCAFVVEQGRGEVLHKYIDMALKEQDAPVYTQQEPRLRQQERDRMEVEQ